MVDQNGIEYYHPRSGRLVREDGTYINEAEFLLLQNDSYTTFNELRTVRRTPLISLASIHNLSVFRDVYTDGLVTHDVDQYIVEPTALLETAKFGRYVPGFSAEAGIGIRFDPAEGTEADWGYFNSQDGLFYRYTDANGYALVIRRGGVDDEILRADWNIDKLDGQGPSKLNLDITDGYIFQVEFTWYGFGPIIWSILDKNAVSGQTRLHPLHVQSVQSGTSLRNPNLPIKAENTGATGNIFVTGRQFSIVGEFIPEQRTTSFVSSPVTVDTNWTPVASFKRKSSGFDDVSLVIDNFTVINSGTEEIEYQILLNPVLTGASPVAPENRSPTETAVEFDTSATSFTGGEQFGGASVPQQSRGDSKPSSGRNSVEVRVPRDYWVTVVARTNLNTSTVKVDFNVVEEF